MQSDDTAQHPNYLEWLGRCVIAGFVLGMVYVWFPVWFPGWIVDNQGVLQVALVGGLVVGTLWTALVQGRESEARRKPVNK